MRRIVAALATIAAVAALPSVAAAAPQPFGNSCRAEHGVRFCPSEDPATGRGASTARRSTST